MDESSGRTSGGGDDFYAKYVRDRRAREDSDKISTLRLPQKQMAAVYGLLDNMLQAVGTNGLPADQIRMWQNIRASVNNSVVNAE